MIKAALQISGDIPLSTGLDVQIFWIANYLPEYIIIPNGLRFLHASYFFFKSAYPSF
jgi:hypothetical protein